MAKLALELGSNDLYGSATEELTNVIAAMAVARDLEENMIGK